MRPRLLLLIPTTSYRTEAFLEAARALGVDIVIASERANALEEAFPDGLLTLDFQKPDVAAREVAEFARRYPFDAVVPVDDLTIVVGAAIAGALGLPSNPVESARAARNKAVMRQRLRGMEVRQPDFTLLSIDDTPDAAASRVEYPCVVKPTILAGSRGVIRADDPGQFTAAFRRLEAILRTPEVSALGDEARQVLVERFVPGVEVALEGLLVRGELRVLALFDKPDPLDGPFFEETVYVTPSRLPTGMQDAIAGCTARAGRALGLQEGPVHAELRVNEAGPWLIEIAARSIGGRCSRALRFGTGMLLEELILRHALGMEIPSLEREPYPAGVMMIPIPGAGVLQEVRGQAEALVLPGIEEIDITAHMGQELVPLPEGWRYLGFIFARAETPEAVEAALRAAHRRLEFVIGELPAPLR
ncbi:MAG: ATP-grasp domain-containing protein [Candidatus Rokubacteria bacterium]|nr:ATP-grasp domain-containing protein [Candidatus Rokubacteria bacterium]